MVSRFCTSPNHDVDQHSKRIDRRMAVFPLIFLPAPNPAESIFGSLFLLSSRFGGDASGEANATKTAAREKCTRECVNRKQHTKTALRISRTRIRDAKTCTEGALTCGVLPRRRWQEERAAVGIDLFGDSISTHN